MLLKVSRYLSRMVQSTTCFLIVSWSNIFKQSKQMWNTRFVWEKALLSHVPWLKHAISNPLLYVYTCQMRPYPLESWPNPTTYKKLVNTQHSTSFQLCGRHIGLSAVYAKRYGVKQLSRTHCCGVSVSPGSQVTERILLLILQNKMMIGNLCNNDKDNLEQLQRLCLRVMLPDDDNYGDILSHLNPEYWQCI